MGSQLATPRSDAAVRVRPAGRSRPGRADIGFGLGVLAQLVAVLVWPRPVTVDGPAHLLGATVLAHYGDPQHPIYRALYRIDPFPSPNLLTEPVLALLVRVVSLGVAEKIIIATYAVLLPVALRYAARGVRRDSGWLWVAALPLTFNYLFFYGFFNYCIGLALCLFVAGYALRRSGAWRPLSTVWLGVLLVLGYLAHLVPFALALVFVAAAAAVRAIEDVRAGGPVAPALVRRLGPPALAAVPGLALTAAFLLRTDEASAPSWNFPLGHLGGLLTLMMPIVTFNYAEAVPAVLAAAVLLGLAAVAARRWGRTAVRRGAGPLLATAVATVLVLAAPSKFGIDFGFINERLSYFPVLFGVLWLAAQPWGRRARRWATGGLLVAAVLLALVRVPALAHYDRLIAEYETVAGVIRPGSTLIAVRFDELTPPGGPVRNSHWDPVRHVESRLAAETYGVDIGHYEAVLDYFPTRFRESRDLRRAIDPTLKGFEEAPPRIDLSRAVRKGRPGIDYVLVVAPDAGHLGDPRVAEVRRDLRGYYRKVAETEPSGLVEVWQARAFR
ncbi:MAG: hypothetical protein GEV03_23600 [Streptosporangiales bacterium]|nr:hypothetical protein [Streptosporangiales bacterium]